MDVLSTAQLAGLLGVGETTIKRWTDDGVLRCHRTPGGHRKFRLREVAEFLESQRVSLDASPTAPAFTDLLALVRRDFPTLRGSIARFALSGSGADVSRLLSSALDLGIPVATVCDELVAPVMHQIGHGWSAGTVTVPEEHLARQTVAEALIRLRDRFARPARPGRTALCACPDGELHDLALLCVARTLESEGWAVTNLGGLVPLTDLVTAVEATRPALVGLSLTYSVDPSEIVAQIRALKPRLQQASRWLVIGGQGWSADEPMGSCRVESCADLVTFVRALPLTIEPT